MLLGLSRLRSGSSGFNLEGREKGDIPSSSSQSGSLAPVWLVQCQYSNHFMSPREACLLLDTLVKRCGVSTGQCRLVPRGSFSAIHVRDEASMHTRFAACVALWSHLTRAMSRYRCGHSGQKFTLIILIRRVAYGQLWIFPGTDSTCRCARVFRKHAFHEHETVAGFFSAVCAHTRSRWYSGSRHCSSSSRKVGLLICFCMGVSCCMGREGVIGQAAICIFLCQRQLLYLLPEPWSFVCLCVCEVVCRFLQLCLCVLGVTRRSDQYPAQRQGRPHRVIT